MQSLSITYLFNARINSNYLLFMKKSASVLLQLNYYLLVNTYFELKNLKKVTNLCPSSKSFQYTDKTTTKIQTKTRNFITLLMNFIN